MTEGWQTKQLDSLARFRNGKSIKPGGIGLHPVYGANGIIGASDDYMYKDAIILGRVGAYCGAVESCSEKFWASDNTIVVEAIPEETYLRFLYYMLIDANLNRHAGGAAQPLLTQSRLKPLEFRIPPLQTQRRIASILSTYDDLIENNTRRIAILEEMARRLYEEWFVHFRFPGHQATTFTETEHGRLPEGWEQSVVADAVKRHQTGKKYDQKTVAQTGSVPVLDQGKAGIIGYHDDEPGFIASPDNPVVVFANHTCYQRLILFPFSAIQNVIPFKSSDAYPRDIYWLHHATLGLVELNDYKGHWPQFAAKVINIPSAALAELFGSHIAPTHKMVRVLEKWNANLRAQRDLLLPKLVSGEIDVSKAEETMETAVA